MIAVGLFGGFLRGVVEGFTVLLGPVALLLALLSVWTP